MNQCKISGKEQMGPQMFNGGSAAQSSTLHVVDGFLQVKHSGSEKKFLLEQRKYMLPAHKQFIEWIEARSALIPGIPDFEEYAETLKALRRFRDEHIKIVNFTPPFFFRFFFLNLKPTKG